MVALVKLLLIIDKAANTIPIKAIKSDIHLIINQNKNHPLI